MTTGGSRQRKRDKCHLRAWLRPRERRRCRGEIERRSRGYFISYPSTGTFCPRESSYAWIDTNRDLSSEETDDFTEALYRQTGCSTTPKQKTHFDRHLLRPFLCYESFSHTILIYRVLTSYASHEDPCAPYLVCFSLDAHIGTCVIVVQAVAKLP